MGLPRGAALGRAEARLKNQSREILSSKNINSPMAIRVGFLPPCPRKGSGWCPPHLLRPSGSACAPPQPCSSASAAAGRSGCWSAPASAGQTWSNLQEKEETASEIVSELLRPHPVLVNLLCARPYSVSDLNSFSKLPHGAASGSRLKDLAKEEKILLLQGKHE